MATDDRPPPASDTARQRREQVIQAAVDVIATQGIHKLSLSRIEERTGMARGHLTYYFPTKEAILLAVFDRMLARMIEDAVADARSAGAPVPGSGAALDSLRHGFARCLGDHPPAHAADLFALTHTFLAQAGHRPDYRAKLAAANAEWRGMLAADIAASDRPQTAVSPRVMASVVMALFQGLTDQLAVDPAAFDRAEMAAAFLTLLAPQFGAGPPPGEPT